MPFVQTVREKYEQKSIKEFEVVEEADFDQLEVLENLSDYIRSTLQLKKIHFAKISETTNNISAEALKNCSPGAPIIVFAIA